MPTCALRFRDRSAAQTLGIAAILAFVLAILPNSVGAATYQTLYSFCSQANCADGSFANGLIADSSGNLYGVATNGGANGYGDVFELSRGQRGQYTYQVIYSFCSLANCADGMTPGGSLILDTSGNLYGTTFSGGGGVGPHGQGEVFELSLNAGTWTLHVLYGFCPGNSCNRDSSGPSAGLSYSGQSSGGLYDGTSPLFGPAYYAGGYSTGGVFELQSGQNGWSDRIIYDFYNHCTNAEKNKCKDGSHIEAPVTVDAAGNIFSTTFEGGKKDLGVAFELGANSWTETVLHSFCTTTGCPDGNTPATGITENAAGHYAGVTTFGGYDNTTYCGSPVHRNLSYGCGVVFMEAPKGKNGKFTESTFYTFCTTSLTCADGAYPMGPPAFDAQGDIFGGTIGGGNSTYINGGGGTVFELTGSTLTTLYSFCTQASCADGSGPYFGVIRDSSGRLYGTTVGGGANGHGVVFKITP